MARTRTTRTVTAQPGRARPTDPRTYPTDSLVPYLPRLSIEWIAERPAERHRVEPGTVVFVDISGFTKLSEALAKHGKVGAEELTATIGNCFVALLDLAVAYGGRLLNSAATHSSSTSRAMPTRRAAVGPPSRCAAPCARWAG